MKSNEILMDFRLSTIEKKLNVYGIVIRKEGEIIADHRWRYNDEVHLYSVSKTFIAIAIGIAIEEGYISIDDKVCDYFQELLPKNPSENLLNLKIHDLLCMGSGHVLCPILKALFLGLEPENWAKLFFDEEIKFAPGTYFEYNNAATYILSAIIKRKVGINAREYLIEKIFKPLKIFNPQWEVCPLGITKGFIGLHLTTENLSRFGQLLLNEGEWEGKRLVSKEFIKKATSKQIETSKIKVPWANKDNLQGYGYQLWMNSYPNSYRLDGLYGQYCVCLPDKKSVVTITSHQEGNQSDILKLVWDTIVDRL